MALINLPSGVVGQLTSLSDQYNLPDHAPVGALVYFSGNLEARTASNASVLTAPARGVVLSKGAVAVGTILFVGEMLGFSGLTPGQDIFLGTGGSIIHAGSLPVNPGEVIQKVGSAVAPDRILFFPNQFIVL